MDEVNIVLVRTSKEKLLTLDASVDIVEVVAISVSCVLNTLVSSSIVEVISRIPVYSVEIVESIDIPYCIRLLL